MADAAQFKEAAAAVKHSPHAVTAWEEVESLAASLDKPDDIGLISRCYQHSRTYARPTAVLFTRDLLRGGH